MGQAPTLLRRKEWPICLVILLLAAALFLLTALPHGQTAVVRIDGEKTHTLPLNQEQTLTVNAHGHTLTIQVRQGAVGVRESDCPDGICRNTPPITRQGQSIVCLPMACSITVEGAAEYDAVTY